MSNEHHRYFWHVGLSLSRTLNALCGSHGDVTFSAQSWEMLLRGSRLGYIRVCLIDGMMGQSHCLDSWAWHHKHGLI